MHILRLYLSSGRRVTFRNRDQPELSFTPTGKLAYVRFPNPENTSLRYVNVDHVTLVQAWEEEDDEDEDEDSWGDEEEDEDAW